MIKAIFTDTIRKCQSEKYFLSMIDFIDFCRKSHFYELVNYEKIENQETTNDYKFGVIDTIDRTQEKIKREYIAHNGNISLTTINSILATVLKELI